MAVPIMVGASFISLLKNWGDIEPDHLSFYMVGFVSAFIFALISIKFFLKLIERVKLTPFAIYRFILAGVLFIIIYM